MDKYNSTVEIHRSSHEAVILRVYPDYTRHRFLAGQYGSLGLISDKGNKFVKRAFSISSSIINSDTRDLINQKDLNYYEFYINRIPICHKGREQITPKIFRLKDGDRIFCGEKIVGHYTYQSDNHWQNIILIGTHTGESPNNSIVNYLLLNKLNINICNINVGPDGWVSSYKLEHDILEKMYSNYRFIQFIDNTKDYKILSRFFLDLISNDNEATKTPGFNLELNSTLVMLCGDPKMIGAPIKKGGWDYEYPDYGLINTSIKNGFTIKTRFKRGNINYESYW